MEFFEERVLSRHSDKRGYFQELSRDEGIAQVNMSSSEYGVLRGLHVAPYSKICTCISGAIFDVVVDVRPASKTYLKWRGVWLTEENKKQVVVPAHCAHGFFSGYSNSILLYAQTGVYDPNQEYCIAWDDPQINVQWPFAEKYIISDQDLNARKLASL